VKLGTGGQKLLVLPIAGHFLRSIYKCHIFIHYVLREMEIEKETIHETNS
jgi:hypothetical protein